MVKLSRLHRASAGSEIYFILRESILSGALPPGSQLDLRTAESQLGVSRSPLKDALRRLEQDGLVQILPQRGTFVASPTKAELQESFDVRLALELHAVKILIEAASDQQMEALADMVRQLRALIQSGEAVARYESYVDLDREFHQSIIRATANERLRKAHERENVHFQMVRIRHGQAERGLEEAQAEHERIIDALVARDEAAAQRALVSHLRRAFESLLGDMAAQQPVAPMQQPSDETDPTEESGPLNIVKLGSEVHGEGMARLRDD